MRLRYSPERLNNIARSPGVINIRLLQHTSQSVLKIRILIIRQNYKDVKGEPKPQDDDPHIILSLTPLTRLKSESVTQRAGFLH